MIGGMDMDQMLAGLGNSSGQFGLGGYNSPSGMAGGAPMGGGGFGQALGMFGRMLGQHGNQQGGEPQQMQQQHGGQGAFQRLLEQLMADQHPQSQGYGGRYANYLTHNL